MSIDPTKPPVIPLRSEELAALTVAQTPEQAALIRADYAARREAAWPGWRAVYEWQLASWIATQNKDLHHAWIPA
jgi:hypothetical protein